LTPGSLASEPLVETCKACWYNNQHIVTIPRFIVATRPVITVCIRDQCP